MLRLTFDIFMTWKFFQHRQRIKDNERMLLLYELEIEKLKNRRRY